MKNLGDDSITTISQNDQINNRDWDGTWGTTVMKGVWRGKKGYWFSDGTWEGRGEWKSRGGELAGEWNGKGTWEKKDEHQGTWKGKGELISDAMPMKSNITNFFITVVGTIAGIIGLLIVLLGGIKSFIIFIIIMILLSVIALKIYIKRKGSWRAKGNWTDIQGVRKLEIDGTWSLGLLDGRLSGTMIDEIEKSTQ